MQVAYQVLRFIATGEFHSGQQLAQKCNVTRARIWQAVELLRSYGLDIHAVKGRGYSLLNPIELLDKDSISQHLSDDCLSIISGIEILNQTDSTNDYMLRTLSHVNTDHLCVAEGQVKGRGRRGKGWYSPLTKNIAMTYYKKMHLSPIAAQNLSLVVGIAVMESIHKLIGTREGLGIKWPNDIWHDGAKLCGILIDTQSDKTKPNLLNVIIGIGLNTHKTVLDDKTNRITSLEEITGRVVSRNELIATIMNEILPRLDLFQSEGFKPFIQAWSEYDLLKNQGVYFMDEHNKEQKGICRGISENGALMIEHGNICKPYINASVTVRPYAVIS